MDEVINSKLALEEENSQTLNIHSAAIHIENKVGLKQRQAWFYMLYKAFPLMESQRIFFINISELKKAINYESNNNEYLKKILEELVTTPVRWNIFDKDKESKWGVSGLLSYCEIESKTGLCEYQFSDKLQNKFLNPSMYAKLNLLVSKRFTSKHSLSIYCLALDYLNIKNNYGEKNLSITELRQYLGLKDTEYIRVVDIHRRILKKAEIDINKDSDMQLSIIPIKSTSKDKITGIKLKMSIKEEYLHFYKSKKSSHLMIELKDDGDKHYILNDTSKKAENLKKDYSKPTKKQPIQIHNEQLKKFFSKYSIASGTDSFQEKLREAQSSFDGDNLEGYLVFLMKYAENEYSKGTIKNFAGFYVSLFRDDTQIDNYLVYQTEQKQKEAQRNKVFEKEVRIELENKYESFIYDDFQEYLLSKIDELSDKITQFTHENIKSGSFIYDGIISRKMKGIFSIESYKELPKSQKLMFFPDFRKDTAFFGYKESSFTEWKNNHLTPEVLDEIKEKIKNR